MKKYVFLGIVFLVYLLIAFFQIQNIPGEWYGDISNVHEYVQQILKGQWPFYFFQSPGPVYHYAIAPIIYISDGHYTSYKIASVIIGLFGIFSLYLLGREIKSVKLGLISAMFGSISFWYIVWARTGNSQIIIPLLSAFTILFSLRFKKYRQLKDLIGGVVVSSLGLFTYPQTFILPGLFILLIMLSLECKLFRLNLMRVVIMFLGFIPAIVLFLYVVVKQSDNFTTGYVGSKLWGGEHLSLTETVSRVFYNLYKTILMFNISGDQTFRINVPKSPQLDVVSGILFLFGFLYLLKKINRVNILFVLLPFIILILPSIAPGIPPDEIPNSGRTIGVLPVVNILVGMGMFLIWEFIPKKIYFLRFLFLPIIIVLVYLNIFKYFKLYPKYLPNSNVPYGKIISNYIDTLPQSTQIYLTACCWGEGGQPEPKAIYYTLRKQYGREGIVRDKFIEECADIKKRPAFIIFDPYDTTESNKFRTCFSDSKIIRVEEKGQKIFTSILVP